MKTMIFCVLALALTFGAPLLAEEAQVTAAAGEGETKAALISIAGEPSQAEESAEESVAVTTAEEPVPVAAERRPIFQGPTYCGDRCDSPGSEGGCINTFVSPWRRQICYCGGSPSSWLC